MKKDIKYIQIEKHIQSIIDIIGIEKTKDIKETPKRVAKMLINELMIGVEKNNFPKYKIFNIAKNNNQYDSNEVVIVNNININSICEHHLLPFIGKATFKYIPKNKVIGLSKIPRIIDFLSRKPQLQERLTLEIFETFKKILNTDNISIEIECEHLCAKIRGVKENCKMITTKKGGLFSNNK